MAASGDPCERCGHHLVVANVKRLPTATVRFLACRRCGFRPADNKLVEKISSTDFLDKKHNSAIMTTERATYDHRNKNIPPAARTRQCG